MIWREAILALLAFAAVSSGIVLLIKGKAWFTAWRKRRAIAKRIVATSRITTLMLLKAPHTNATPCSKCGKVDYVVWACWVQAMRDIRAKYPEFRADWCLNCTLEMIREDRALTKKVLEVSIIKGIRLQAKIPLNYIVNASSLVPQKMLQKASEEVFKNDSKNKKLGSTS